MIKVIYACFLVFTSSVAELSKWEKPYHAEVSKSLEIVDSIKSIALNCRDAKQNPYDLNVTRAKVKELLYNTSLTSNNLYQIGMTTGVLYSGDASHVAYDEAYKWAHDVCASLLSQREDGYYYLLNMSYLFGRDGGGSLIYKELLKDVPKS